MAVKGMVRTALARARRRNRRLACGMSVEWDEEAPDVTLEP